MRKIFRKDDERGATAILVVGFLTVIVIIFGLVIDGGSQRVANRSMQGVADVTAMDLSRRIDGVSSGVVLKPIMDSTITKIRQRNPGWKSNAVITYQLGIINSSAQFQEIPVTQVPTAVKVTATDNRQWLTSSRNDASTRTSIAAATIEAGGDCFRIGSYEGVLGTSGEKGLNSFFNKMFSQAVTFGNTSTAANFDWKKVASEKINMTAVGTRMGYATVNDFRNANVNLRDFYAALYAQLAIDAPTSEAFRHVSAVRNMINNVQPLPMSKILGTGLKGTIYSSALDVLGGMMTYYNDGRSVNPNFDSTFTSVYSQGPTQIEYLQGARQHCAQPGETFSTAGTNPDQQIYMQLNGTLTPQNYTSRFYSPGLINTTGNVQLGYMGLGLKVEPVVMTVNSVSCTPTTKTANFDLSKGSITMSLPGPQGGTTYAGSQYPGLVTNLNGYGPVKIEWGFNLNFKAKLNLAPSTGNVVTADASTINKPLYILGNESRFEVDVSDSVNNFSYFRVLKDSNQWYDWTPQMSASEIKKLKEAITMAYVEPLLDRSNSNSFFNNYVNGSLGFSGSSIFGPSVMFDSLACGGSGGKATVKLVG